MAYTHLQNTKVDRTGLGKFVPIHIKEFLMTLDKEIILSSLLNGRFRSYFSNISNNLTLPILQVVHFHKIHQL